VHPPTSLPGAQVEFARSAIGVTVPSTNIQNLSIVHPSSGIAVNGTAAKTSVGGNANEIRHENPHPVAIAGPSIHSTGLNGTAMGHPIASPAELGGALPHRLRHRWSEYPSKTLACNASV
jgi:hypothetical protein